MWIRQVALVTIAVLLAASPAGAARGDDRLCDQAIAVAEARRNTIRTEVRRRQETDSFEAAGLRIINDHLKQAGWSRDRRDWSSCVWHAQEALNFGRPDAPRPPVQLP